MPLLPDLETLETDRLILRRSRVSDAPVYRQLWAERDPRVPPHRRMTAEGWPTLEEVAAHITADNESTSLGLLAVERKGAADVIGYCGLTARGSRSPHEPELAYELLQAARNQGYATEAGEAIVTWARESALTRLWAEVWDWNLASRRVLHKLGFREVERVEPASAHGYTLLTVKDL